MIVETNSLTTIAVGSQKASTEPGDTSLKLPNLILPTIELMEPVVIFPDNNNVTTQSFTQSRFLSRTNQAGASSLIVRMGPGLWRLSFDWMIKYSYAAAVAFNTKENNVRLICPIGGISVDLITMLVLQSGLLIKKYECRVLLRENSELYLVVGATGAADFLDSNLNMVGEKLL